MSETVNEKLKCSTCNKETSIKTVDGLTLPLCFDHYMALVNSSQYAYIQKSMEK